MVKKRYRLVTKKRKKLHPLFKIIASFLGVVVLTLLVSSLAFKNTNTMEVAGASTSSATLTQKSCVAVGSVIGYLPCQKDMYRAIAVTCGDGTHMASSASSGDTSCRSLSAWMTQVAHMCANHSSCNHPTVTPSARPTPSGFPKKPQTFFPPHASITPER